jgi:hypothetical protein
VRLAVGAGQLHPDDGTDRSSGLRPAGDFEVGIHGNLDMSAHHGLHGLACHRLDVVGHGRHETSSGKSATMSKIRCHGPSALFQRAQPASRVNLAEAPLSCALPSECEAREQEPHAPGAGADPSRSSGYSAPDDGGNADLFDALGWFCWLWAGEH